MIRLMGILTGSALGIALLILVFGLPDLASQRGEPVVEPAPATVVEPAAESIVEPAGIPPTESPQQAAEPVPPQPAEPVTVAPQAAEVNEPATAVLAEAAIPLPDAAPEEQQAPATPTAHHWYAFWSPFRSRIAADGFVAELQRTTGLDYRVVKLKPGIYEVAFAYTDDADIRDKLDRISAATGMDMSGG